MNMILRTDSYKASHYLQYPPNTTGVFSYIEARRGRLDRVMFFGLQAFLKQYMSVPVTKRNVDEAAEFFTEHGEPFNYEGWMRVVEVHDGFIPVKIGAVPEGTVVPTGNVLATVESTDWELPWATSYVETPILRGIWYPTSVGTISWRAKQSIRAYMAQTSDTMAGLPFKLHDFGARGVSSAESAELGGMAHLVNFKGTDTVEAIMAARRYYYEKMAGYSIPAAEHSTMTAWGREGEADAYANMLKQFGGEGRLVAVVSDSYDLFNAVKNIWGGSLKQQVIDSGALVVIRPDSGNPAEVVRETALLLQEAFGSKTNRKGYEVLNNVRIIQGDGINLSSIDEILDTLTKAKFSTDNIAFGMGGALLQQVNRDTFGFAMKASAVRIGNEWREISKDPVTDQGKISKRGRVTLVHDKEINMYLTKQEDLVDPNRDEVIIRPVWDTGRLFVDDKFEDIRRRSVS